jgi:hypothetical protein
MLHHSHFQPDTARIGEWLACLWQGPAPADLVIRQWLYLPGEPRSMIMVWDGGAAAEAFVERAFGGFGQIETHRVTDATPGMALAVARDLDGFDAWMTERGASRAEIDRQIDLRRRGRDAPSQAAAAEAGAAWAAGGEQMVRFASDAWLALMNRILGELVAAAGSELDGQAVRICEIATGAPADLADPARGDGSLAWHIVIDGPSAHARKGELADADFGAAFDYQAIQTLARWVYKDDPDDQAAVAKAREVIETSGKFTAIGSRPQLSPRLGRLLSDLHNGLARLTA